MTLTEFLLAWIAEDEAAAHAADVMAPGVADRLLAECAAKRRIVEDCAAAWEQRRPNGTPTEWGHHAWGGLEHACRVLATAYSDHPDYREEWKP